MTSEVLEFGIRIRFTTVRQNHAVTFNEYNKMSLNFLFVEIHNFIVHTLNLLNCFILVTNKSKLLFVDSGNTESNDIGF